MLTLDYAGSSEGEKEIVVMDHNYFSYFGADDD